MLVFLYGNIYIIMAIMDKHLLWYYFYITIHFTILNNKDNVARF